MEEGVEQHFQEDQTRQEENLVNDSIKRRQRSYIYWNLQFHTLVKQTRNLLIFSYINQFL